MKKKNYIFIKSFTWVLFLASAYGFNWDRCDHFISRDTSISGAGLFSSSTSYISSTGECSMNSNSNHENKVFYLHNKRNIQDDIVRGKGDYLSAFLKLMGCKSKEAGVVGTKIKESFGNLMVMDNSNQFEFIKSKCKEICWDSNDPFYSEFQQSLNRPKPTQTLSN